MAVVAQEDFGYRPLMHGAQLVRREPASRRQFLKTGLVGSLALVSAGVAGRWLIRTAYAEMSEPALGFLRPRDRALVRAITAAFLDGVLPREAALRRQTVEQAILGADRYFSTFAPAVQAEALGAFDLLNLWLGRRLVAGVSEPWERAKAEEVNRFLESFRTSGFDTFRQIYRLLEGIATVGWYGLPASWPQLGYPGPVQIARPKGDAPL
ncbi:MAG: hypothetical protein OEW21_06465 [Betaproteobacteria bacterium]|nr:hypothetical protein [Betaproteobacteria bacterium]